MLGRGDLRDRRQSGRGAAFRHACQPPSDHRLCAERLLAGFAALVVIARINAADSGLGEDLLLPAIAAVCLGGTSLFGGVGGIIGTAVGSLILALVVNGMNLLGVQTFWQTGVMGAIILISVLADQLGGTRLARAAVTHGGLHRLSGSLAGSTRTRNKTALDERNREETSMDRRTFVKTSLAATAR